MSSEDAIGTVVSVQSPTQMLPPSTSTSAAASASSTAGSVLGRPANQAMPTSLTRDDSSITSGSSGFGSLPKKKPHTPEKTTAITPATAADLQSMHAESDPLAAFVANSLVTDSGISESSDATATYSADNAKPSPQQLNLSPTTTATPTMLPPPPPSLTAMPLTASSSASSSSPLSVLNHPSTTGQLQAGVGLPLLSHPHSPVAATDLGHSRNSSNTSQVSYINHCQSLICVGLSSYEYYSFQKLSRQLWNDKY